MTLFFILISNCFPAVFLPALQQCSLFRLDAMHWTELFVFRLKDQLEINETENDDPTNLNLQTCQEGEAP